MLSCLILSFCCFRFCKKWCLQIITLYLFASFNTAILCSVHPKWFVKYVYGQIWFVKTWIMKYESGVVKSNPGICICMYVYIYIYMQSSLIQNDCSWDHSKAVVLWAGGCLTKHLHKRTKQTWSFLAGFFAHSNIYLWIKIWPVLVPFLKIKNVWSYFSFWTYIAISTYIHMSRSRDGCLFNCNTGTKAKNATFYQSI